MHRPIDIANLVSKRERVAPSRTAWTVIAVGIKACVRCPIVALSINGLSPKITSRIAIDRVEEIATGYLVAVLEMVEAPVLFVRSATSVVTVVIWTRGVCHSLVEVSPVGRVGNLQIEDLIAVGST